MEFPADIPLCLREALEAREWAQVTDGASGALVYRLEQRDEPTFYLKCGGGKTADDITAEMVRLQWLGRYVRVPRVDRFCHADGHAWLLTEGLPGRSAYECFTSQTAGRLETISAIAEFLRRLHAIPVVECPFHSGHELRMVEAQRNLESGKANELDFDAERRGRTGEQVWTEMQGLLPLGFDSSVTHGDFSLDNLMLDGGKVSGCLDVGRAGVADPYQDLSILWRDLEEFGGEVRARFFEAYGLSQPDARKIQFHLCLDEFF